MEVCFPLNRNHVLLCIIPNRPVENLAAGTGSGFDIPTAVGLWTAEACE